ncbi:hypothetical protein GXW71_09905 [Roseomonas hellenica]|uniref:Uncharacterized protein n=1 Tax=Plastoroseomonas hellenica TaxID=2687306 RepID=A0ABS5EXM9_9PROT|nr:hypothetical protein [Plastoroseomonas hellenica]MBR0664665.1 hypothetical protein [Plastoroseomonas hellenica]
MSDPVPAVTEAAATGEIAAIFDDIRSVLGVEVVNLVWRHLATFDGALSWTWSTLRPLYAHGTLQEEARKLRACLALPQVQTIRPEVFAAIGLPASALDPIRSILAAYDHTNAMALFAFSALRVRLGPSDEQSPDVSVASRPAPQPESLIALPRLPRMEELSAETAALVMELNKLGTDRTQPSLASMYRHLAYWPPYLALAWAILTPLHASGALADAIRAMRGEAERRAAVIKLHLGRAALPSPAIGPAVTAAIEPFVGDAILKMTVICALLRSAT